MPDGRFRGADIRGRLLTEKASHHFETVMGRLRVYLPTDDVALTVLFEQLDGQAADAIVAAAARMSVQRSAW